VKFQFVSYNKRTFIIKKNDEGIFQVFTISEKKEVVVNKIFVKIDGGTFWVPNIKQVELHARDAKTGEKRVEIVKP